MTPDTITRHLTETLPGVDIVEKDGDFYYFYDPKRDVPPDYKFPFATLVTGDRHDTFSNLDRPGVYRLNIGVSKKTYFALFGEQKLTPDEHSAAASGYDFTALDTIVPHPVYGRMFWVSALCPSEATFETIKPLLDEAHAMAAKRTK